MCRNQTPRRIVSLQPSVTLVLRDLGKLDLLVGCTKYCLEACPEIAKHSIAIVADSWTPQSEQIRSLKPDFVIASVPYQEKSIAEILKAHVPFLALAPKTLADVYSDIAIIARIANAPERGEEVLAKMEAEVELVRQKSAGLSRPKVFCEEWPKPLIASQEWVAELVEAAGGEFVGTPGKQSSFERVAEVDPDVMIMAWCGAGGRVPLEKTIAGRNWDNLSAVQNGRVYCIADEYLNTPRPVSSTACTLSRRPYIPKLFHKLRDYDVLTPRCTLRSQPIVDARRKASVRNETRCCRTHLEKRQDPDLPAHPSSIHAAEVGVPRREN